MDSMIPTTVPAVIGSNSEDPATAATVSNSDSTLDLATISTMDPAMYFAAKHGDVGYLKSMVELADSPISLSSFLTPQNNTILHIAIRFLQVEFAEKILKTEPSLLVQANTKGDTPLHVAMISGHMTTIELLTRCYKEREVQQDPESGFSEWRAANSEGNTALHLSLISRNPKVALKLLSEYHGHANCVNNAQESPLYLAASFGYVDVVRRLLSIDDVSLMGPNCQSPLHAAAAMFAGTTTQKEDRKAITRLLCKKVPHIIRQRDVFGRTALHYSAATPAKGITRILLRSDRMLAYIPDKDGHTPLLIAVLLENWNTINIILRYCPDCGEICDSSGQNAFHLVMREKLNILRILEHPELKHLLNGKDDQGNTPFHLAASAHYHTGVRRLLQQKGVDFVAMNKSSLTVLDYADTWECITVESYRDRINLISNGVVRRASKIGQKANIQSARPIKELQQLANTLLVVATLLTTITFAAVFQVPGGYSSDKPGIALFAKKTAFQIFLLTDSSVIFISMLCIFFLAWGLTTGNQNLRTALTNVFRLFGLAVYMSTITFVTAVYLIVEEIKWLAISIIVMGCFSTIIIKFQHNMFPRFHNPRVSNHTLADM